MSGMILDPDMYTRTPVDRRQGRVELGLDPDRVTALIMFGGNGSWSSVKILNRLRKANLPLQSIVMCGHNEDLYEALRFYPGCCPVKFTDKVAHYMERADFFIGKPGPASISEALLRNLPVIVENGLRTMPQERYNAVWVVENNLGLAVSNFNQIAKPVAQLLQDDQLERYRRHAAALHNRAIYEIPAILSDIFAKHDLARSVPSQRNDSAA